MTIHRMLFAVIPLAALLAAGCDDKGSGAKPSPSASGAPAKSGPASTASAAPTASSASSKAAATAGKKRHARGAIGMVFRAADHAALPDDKKAALSKIEEPFLSEETATRAEYKALHADLVLGVKEGKLDAKKIAADEAALDKDLEATQAKHAEALNAVHAALDGGQRKALVAAIRADWEKRGKGEHGKGDHAPVAPSASGSAAPAAGDWTRKRLEHLTTELDLDAAQQKSVGELLAKGADHAGAEAHRASSKKHMETMLTAFEGDTFDAKKIMADEKMPKAEEATDKHVKFLTDMLAILKPAQREKLAASMEKGHWTIGANGERRMGGDHHDGDEDRER